MWQMFKYPWKLWDREFGQEFDIYFVVSVLHIFKNEPVLHYFWNIPCIWLITKIVTTYEQKNFFETASSLSGLPAGHIWPSFNY